MENADLGAGKDQLHNTTTGPQGHDTLYFDFDFNQSLSPGLDPGPPHAACHHQAFMVGPDSEPEEEQEGEEEQDEYVDNYVWLQPDVGPDDESPNEDGEAVGRSFRTQGSCKRISWIMNSG